VSKLFHLLHERMHLGVIFPPRFCLDPTGNINTPRPHSLNCLRHISRYETTGEEQTGILLG
jgi:hypothetical protein